ncbi:GTP-binding protein HflX [Nitrosomonas eutropha]|uniref:GTPase HflX n=1 Tax=Nitrosomonas TaxID=914 RepID=UPI00088113D0|nr:MULTISPECIES: GTPase HflX [Nitrosomonas]MXS79277.1 GTPase HflX [Nitrosomonas sp. GH22]SCX18486.1 GTP-binding protein HflX [Nitrosomonas eutropha]SDW63346.1 GTP-binding protein HflX [Nitrosomonas eutropha]
MNHDIGTAADNTAILVDINFGKNDKESLDELKELAYSDQLSIVAVVEGTRKQPDPATFIGKGKVEEISQIVVQTQAAMVIFNHELSPIQQRNLSTTLACRVIDRTSLILDIFAQRAKSHEGKLQVELAQLEYLSTRLVRGWTHLERQKGGIGLRGPGETQLETDRRLLAKRVKFLKEKLAKLKQQRDVQRRARKRSEIMSVSIVGYTNAGKSTLFNRLVRSDAYAADKLFATLDTTTRRLFLPERGLIVISDTVGFIRDLPHTLVAAFRATLEETIQADLLLHVVDVSSSNRDVQISEVNKLLQEIGADTIPQILILNKIDLIEQGSSENYMRDEYGRIARIHLSARTGAGFGYLYEALVEAFDQNLNKLSSIQQHP